MKYTSVWVGNRPLLNNLLNIEINWIEVPVLNSSLSFDLSITSSYICDVCGAIFSNRWGPST